MNEVEVSESETPKEEKWKKNKETEKKKWT